MALPSFTSCILFEGEQFRQVKLSSTETEEWMAEPSHQSRGWSSTTLFN